MKIVIATKSAVKLTALEQALREVGLDAEIESVSADSRIDEQPLGMDVTTKGAKNRLSNARRKIPGADAYVAIENGVMREVDKFVDRAVVLLVKKSENTSGYRRVSQGVCFPATVVAASVASNLTQTVGKLMADGGLVTQHDDPHRDLELLEEPGVKKPRGQILRETLVAVLRDLKSDLGR